jgi:hypothetical protein
MDGVGTSEMANSLAKIGLFTSLMKNYSANELIDFFGQNSKSRLQNVAYSMGITESDF